MAKITAKASLVLGTNLQLHIGDKGGTDIVINDNGDGTGTITSTTTDFTDVSSSGGITNRALVVGDKVVISHSGLVANEGKSVTLTAVGANSLSYDDIDTLADESAGEDINIVAFKKTYQFLEAGGLSFIDGVQGIVLASVLVDLWDTNDLDRYDKPFSSIEPRAKSLASVNGWECHDLDTLNAVRDTALEYRDAVTEAARKIFALFRSNPLHDTADQFNFWPASATEMTAPTSAVMTGYINQLFEVYDAAGNDNRGGWYTRCAESGKTIVMESHSVNYAEIYPVSSANGIDPKLQASDATISAGGDYANIDITVDAALYSGDVGGTNYDFAGYIECDSKVNQTVHEKINYLLRQATDINQGAGGAMRGDKQWPITSFSGEVFTLQDQYPLNFNATQRNDLRVVDHTGVTRQWPGILTFTVASDPLGIGGVFTVWHKDSYGTSGAIPLQDENSVDQQDIAIQALVDIVVAYSTYNVDGHTPNTPIEVTISYNRPGYIEPDNIEAILDGTNKTATLALTSDPSYIV